MLAIIKPNTNIKISGDKCIFLPIAYKSNRTAISKNSFTYTPDLKRINRHVTVATEQVIGAGTTHAITTLTFLPGDDIYHAAISVACSFPGAAIAGQPTISATCTAAAPIGVETLNAVTTTARVGFLRAAVDVSSTTPYTEVQVNLTAGGGIEFGSNEGWTLDGARG